MAMHKARIWSVGDAEEVEAVAAKLHDMTWCRCDGFRVGGILLLNDSTGPDGAQEYAVVDEATMEQFESITVSWMTKDRLTEVIREMSEGGWDRFNFGTIDRARVQTPEQHGKCAACA